jgi:hypothetical protein
MVIVVGGGGGGTKHTTRLLTSNYRTFLLVVCMDFVTQNGPSAQVIDATKFIEK